MRDKPNLNYAYPYTPPLDTHPHPFAGKLTDQTQPKNRGFNIAMTKQMTKCILKTK